MHHDHAAPIYLGYALVGNPYQVEIRSPLAQDHFADWIEYSAVVILGFSATDDGAEFLLVRPPEHFRSGSLTYLFTGRLRI
ncbi:MAG: hypothetical protein JNL67_02805 [Planctomycetaceae bacterium]|nr:hypothetical protein [Planctomycetaceae bacterium]